MPLRVQRDEDLAVRRPERHAVREGEIDGRRLPDVVEHQRDLVPRDEATDRRFHVRKHLFGLLDPRAGRRPHVKPELPGVHGRKEVASDEREEGESTGDDQGKGHEHARAPSEGRLQRPDVGPPERLEASIEGVMDAAECAERGATAVGMVVNLAREQVADAGGDDRAREQVRGQHGEHDGHPEGREEILRGADEKHHGHEDDADREGRDERRRRDLRGAVEDRLEETLAEAQVAVDVLDLHGGVVDEDADRQRQPTERHHVERLAERAQDRQRREDRRAP